MAGLDSQVKICNAALNRIGVHDYITDITDDTAEANACELHYENIRDTLLAEVDWQFARKRVTLTTEAGDPPDEWDYQYQVPSDMIVARKITSGIRLERTDQKYPFRIEWNDTASKQLIYCDVEDAELQYTYRVTDVAQYPPWFSNVFAWRLAQELAMPLSKKAKLFELAVNSAEFYLGLAMQNNYGGEHEDTPETESIAARD